MKTKVCTKCKNRKPIIMFHNVSRNIDGLADWCRRCFNAANIVWREKNWERKIEQQKERRHSLRKYVDSIRATKCMLCTENEMCCLEYHHLDSKKKDINPGDMVGQGWSKERIDKELAKCVCLCSNCHRKVHKGILKI